jgi:hypothetical protein
MKIRTGFVSNSSSSSFIIRGTASTHEVAKKMYLIMIEDYKEFEYKLPREHEEVMKWFDKNIGFDDPIIIPWTINYETFIWKTNSGVSVSTCNNIVWDDLHDDYIIDTKLDENLPYDSDAKYLDLKNIKGERLTKREWLKRDYEEFKKQCNLIRKQRENDGK